MFRGQVKHVPTDSIIWMRKVRCRKAMHRASQSCSSDLRPYVIAQMTLGLRFSRCMCISYLELNPEFNLPKRLKVPAAYGLW